MKAEEAAIEAAEMQPEGFTGLWFILHPSSFILAGGCLSLLTSAIVP